MNALFILFWNQTHPFVFFSWTIRKFLPMTCSPLFLKTWTPTPNIWSLSQPSIQMSQRARTWSGRSVHVSLPLWPWWSLCLPKQHQVIIQLSFRGTITVVLLTFPSSVEGSRWYVTWEGLAPFHCVNHDCVWNGNTDHIMLLESLSLSSSHENECFTVFTPPEISGIV